MNLVLLHERLPIEIITVSQVEFNPKTKTAVMELESQISSLDPFTEQRVCDYGGHAHQSRYLDGRDVLEDIANGQLTGLVVDRADTKVRFVLRF